MKKLLVLLLCAVFCLSFIGCTDEDTPKKETATVNSTVKKSDTEFGLNDSAVFKNLKFTALEIEESDGTSFFTPEESNVFVGIKLEIENVSDEDQAVSTLLLFEGYVDDVKCSYSLSAACVFSDGSLDGTISPGKKLIGWYALEVPENWKELELQVKSDLLSSKTAKFVFNK